MPTSDSDPILSPHVLRVSGAMLGAQTALAHLIQGRAVAASDYDQTALDLLVRLDLADTDGLRITELAEQLLLSPSHVSRTVDAAAAAGLVDRRTDPRDRRAARVTLADHGREVLEQFAPRLHAVLNKAIHDQLTPEESDQLVALLRRIEVASRSAWSDDEPDPR